MAPRSSWRTKGRILPSCKPKPSLSIHFLIIYAYSLSLLTDASALFGTVDSKLFPGLPSTVSVHSGFRDAHAASATAVLAAVKKVITERVGTKVTVGEYSALHPLIYIEIYILCGNSWSFFGRCSRPPGYGVLEVESAIFNYL